MTISPSDFFLLISFLVPAACAATVTYDFDVAWTYANPDGQYNRPVIGINGQWPIPPIVATKGDQVVVNVKNSLGNESTSLHFHGLYMNGTTHMDGPVAVNQCGILPGSSFTYNFTVDQVSRVTILVRQVASSYITAARHLLVSQPRTWPVPRWTPRSTHCERPGQSVQRSV